MMQGCSVPVGVASLRHLLECVGNTVCIESVGRAGESERLGGEGVVSRCLCTGQEPLPVVDRERRAGTQHRQV
jgi:hypothetical protein